MKAQLFFTVVAIVVYTVANPVRAQSCVTQGFQDVHLVAADNSSDPVSNKPTYSVPPSQFAFEAEIMGRLFMDDAEIPRVTDEMYEECVGSLPERCTAADYSTINRDLNRLISFRDAVYDAEEAKTRTRMLLSYAIVTSGRVYYQGQADIAQYFAHRFPLHMAGPAFLRFLEMFPLAEDKEFAPQLARLQTQAINYMIKECEGIKSHPLLSFFVNDLPPLSNAVASSLFMQSFERLETLDQLVRFLMLTVPSSLEAHLLEGIVAVYFVYVFRVFAQINNALDLNGDYTEHEIEDLKLERIELFTKLRGKLDITLLLQELRAFFGKFKEYHDYQNMMQPAAPSMLAKLKDRLSRVQPPWNLFRSRQTARV